MTSKLLVVGAGGHGRSVAEAVLLNKEYEFVGFIDDNWKNLRAIWDRPVLGDTHSFKSILPQVDCAIVAIGNNTIREHLQEHLSHLGFKLATVIHPQSIVSPTAVLGEGCAIMAGAAIGTEAKLGRGVIVNCGAVVDHHCTVEDFGHLGVNACMAGGSILGRNAWLQAGSALGYGTHIPAGSVLKPGEARG